MNDYSVLIGGKSGFGIDKSGTVIGLILNRLGRHIYIYRDYPSLIRGGHTFSIIRSSKEKILTHVDKVDLILALNQDTFNLHKDKLTQIQNNDDRKFQACWERKIEFCIIDTSQQIYFKENTSIKYLKIIESLVDKKLSCNNHHVQVIQY